MSDKEDLDSIKNQLRIITIVIIVCWMVMFFGFIFWWLLDIFDVPSSNIGFSLKSLNSMGGAFNIIIALTGVITVWLLSKAVYFQKEELIEIKVHMEAQKNSIEENEKINRAIRLYEEWRDIKDNDSYADRRRLTNEEKNFIVVATNLSYSRAKKHIDIDLLYELLKNDGITTLLYSELGFLNQELRMRKERGTIRDDEIIKFEIDIRLIEKHIEEID